MEVNEIHDICKKYGIKYYTINLDGSIDVDRSVSLNNIGLVDIPLKFNNVLGFFDCSENNLTSLKGCPKYVGNWFDCSYNNLTSLVGGPNKVNKFYDCDQNNITSLEGCPSIVEILNITNNNLKTLNGINIPYSKLDHFIGIEKLIRKHKLTNYLKL